MAWTFSGAAVGGCAHRFACASVRTRHHPGTIAALEGRIWLPRACDRLTEAFGCSPTNARLGSGCMTHRSAIFLSKALRFDRCAAWHRARALRNTVWMRVSHPADSEWCSTDTSGVSSKRLDSGAAAPSELLGRTLLPCVPGVAVMKGDPLQGLPGLQALVH